MRETKTIKGLVACSRCGSVDRTRLVCVYNRPVGFPVQRGHENDKRYWCRCTSCGFETNNAVSGLRELTGAVITDDQAADQAIQYWQEQKTHDAVIRELFREYPEHAWQEYERMRGQG